MCLLLVGEAISFHHYGKTSLHLPSVYALLYVAEGSILRLKEKHLRSSFDSYETDLESCVFSNSLQ